MIVIKDMEMPKCCIFCLLYVGKKGEGHCAITHKWNAVGGLNRLDDCPLVEIEERKVGNWIRKLIRNDKGGCIGAEMICSCCNKGNRHDEYMDYCPNCGASFKEEKRGNSDDSN